MITHWTCIYTVNCVILGIQPFYILPSPQIKFPKVFLSGQHFLLSSGMTAVPQVHLGQSWRSWNKQEPSRVGARGMWWYRELPGRPSPQMPGIFQVTVFLKGPPSYLTRREFDLDGKGVVLSTYWTASFVTTVSSNLPLVTPVQKILAQMFKAISFQEVSFDWCPWLSRFVYVPLRPLFLYHSFLFCNCLVSQAFYSSPRAVDFIWPWKGKSPLREVWPRLLPSMRKLMTAGLESAQKCRNVLTVNLNSSSRPGSVLGVHPELECGTPVSHLSTSEGSFKRFSGNLGQVHSSTERLSTN